MFKRFAIALTLAAVCSGPTYARSTALPTSGEITEEEGQPTQGSFGALLERYRTQLSDMEYHARRYSAYFTPVDHSIMQALQHTMVLADKVKGFGIERPEGREAFFQLKQPLSHITGSIKNTPSLRHVVSMWDKSILTYQKMVNHIEGVDATPEQGLDPNHPGLQLLQTQAEDLRQAVFAFEHQIKTGLPIVNQENKSLVAYLQQFSVYCDKLKTHSLSFITERHYMAETMRKAVDVSRQINALMIYQQHQHIVLSWQTIRQKANTLREQFEALMADMQKR